VITARPKALNIGLSAPLQIPACGHSGARAPGRRRPFKAGGAKCPRKTELSPAQQGFFKLLPRGESGG